VALPLHYRCTVIALWVALVHTALACDDCTSVALHLRRPPESAKIPWT
jgi:hypothetical protein